MEQNSSYPLRARLQEFIEYKGMTKHKFESICNFSSRYISNVNNITGDKLETISNKFPELNIDWLVTGRGEMLNIPHVTASNNSCGDNSCQTIMAAGNDINKTMTAKEHGDKLIESILNIQKKNSSLETENTVLRAKIAMLEDQLAWMKSMISK